MLRSLLTKYSLVLLCLVFLPIYLHNLVGSPMGLTADEAAFGYNATLLSKTGYDENGRYLPVFVNSLEGRDWRQPFTQYYQAAFFKLFGASMFNLRFSNLVLVFAIAFALYYLSNLIFKKNNLSLLSVFFYLTTSIVFIHGHYALDNNAPLLFQLLFLIFLYKYLSKKQFKYLLYAGISLGVCFYTYKAMRAVVPVWTIATLVYLYFQTKSVKSLICLLAGLFPFAVAAPILQHIYPGSVFDKSVFHFISIYDFTYPFISSFDLGFLYIKGDDTVFHSTGIHGMFLLATLMPTLYGFYKIVQDKNRQQFLFFTLILLLTTPSLLGLAGSVHRASRLMVFVPFFALAFTHGLSCFNSKYTRLVIFAILLNFTHLFYYYHSTYNLTTQAMFGKQDFYPSYQTLEKLRLQHNAHPYIDTDLYHGHGVTGKFFATAYLSTKLLELNDPKNLPAHSIFMTNQNNIDNLQKISCDQFSLCFFLSP